MRNLAARLQARLASGGTGNPDRTPSTEAVIALWSEIAAVLAPVIGTLGMAALFRRALSLSLPDAPSLGIALTAQSGTDDFAGFREALSSLPHTEVARTNDVLLHRFCVLLATLIGDALTERLLNQVPDVASSGREPVEISR